MENFDDLLGEVTWKAVKSSGPGGQHVNKTASKVVLHFDIPNSSALTEEKKAQLLNKLSSRLTTEGVLILESSASRSQHKNREIGMERFLEVIRKGLIKPRPRKKTKPSKASKLKRLREKKIKSEKKSNRQKPSI